MNITQKAKELSQERRDESFILRDYSEARKYIVKEIGGPEGYLSKAEIIRADEDLDFLTLEIMLKRLIRSIFTKSL